MSIVILPDLCAQVGLTPDAPPGDLDILQQKNQAAQNHVERLLGYRIEERFGGEDQEPVPSALAEAVMQLAAWWFENREAGGDGARAMPFGVEEIVTEYREWSF